MVVFTCGHCGESVQKPKVEKHYLTKCRNRNPNLSCMDCFKDFLGKDYEAHTKCITEEERYSGKGFTAKEKKGEKKQNAWVEMLQSVLDEQKSAPRNVLRIIESISKHNNTPRKKPKFINFVKNVCGHKTNAKDIDQAWDLISVKLSALSNANLNSNQKKNESEDDDKNKEENDGEKNNKEKDNIINNERNDQDGDESIDIKGNIDNDNDQNGFVENKNEELDDVSQKKLSKKQRKEEKKRKKYEAELQSAVEQPEETEQDETQNNNKKGKKKKNKSESSNGEVEETQHEGKNKNKKRKRQDTTNSVSEILNNVDDNAGTEPVMKEKAQKKKLKVDGEEADESICLHDQNVAKIEELSMKNDFNWHAVIMSVLEKKGNEVPFKRLQKKVLSEYSETTGHDVDDRIADKFIKKLKSAPNVRVVKNTVILVQ